MENLLGLSSGLYGVFPMQEECKSGRMFDGNH